MNATAERRFVAGLLFWGAVFGLVGNALHPFFPPDVSAERFLSEVSASSIWAAVHLILLASVVLLGAAVVMLGQRLTGTSGESLGRFSAVLALIGVVLFVMWQGILDGAVLSALAQDLSVASDDAMLLVTAEAMLAFEFGLASLSVMILLGATFLALGLALHRANVFALWIRWTLITAGAAGTVTGTMMFLGLGEGVTFYAFRIVGLAETIAAFGLSVQLFRGGTPAAETPSTDVTGQPVEESP